MAATFGQQMLDMRYIDETNDSKTWMSGQQRSILAVLTIGGAWIESRVDDLAVATRPISYFKWVISKVHSLCIIFTLCLVKHLLKIRILISVFELVPCYKAISVSVKNCQIHFCVKPA